LVINFAGGRQKYILSYGGGVNSVALLFYIIEEKMPLDEVIFADTGGELPDTYFYTYKIKSFLEKRGIPFSIVKVKQGNLYERCKSRRVIPSQIWRWCTRDLKIRPIHAYYRSLKTHVNQYLGISFEENDRAKESKVDYITSIYPLVEEKITRDDCIDLIYEKGLTPPVRSGCFFCPFNSVSRWCEIFKNHRDLYYKAMELEESSKYFPKQRLTTITLRLLKNSIENNDTLPLIQVKKPCGSECLL
jgi:hypothetical protein